MIGRAIRPQAAIVAPTAIAASGPEPPGAIRGAEDHRHQKKREHDLDDDRCRRCDVWRGHASGGGVAEQAAQDERRDERAAHLCRPVGQEPRGRKVPAEHECQRHRRVEMGTRLIGQRIDHRRDDECRGHRPGGNADLAAAHERHRVRACRGEHERERAEHLATHRRSRPVSLGGFGSEVASSGGDSLSGSSSGAARADPAIRRSVRPGRSPARGADVPRPCDDVTTVGRGVGATPPQHAHGGAKRRWAPPKLCSVARPVAPCPEIAR